MHNTECHPLSFFKRCAGLLGVNSRMLRVMSKDTPKKFFRAKRVLVALLAGLIGLWMVNPVILSTLCRYGLEFGCLTRGFVFKADSVRAGIGLPLVIEGLSLTPRGPKFTQRLLVAERVEMRWSGMLSWFSSPVRLIKDVEITRLYCLIDRRWSGFENQVSASQSPSAALGSFLADLQAPPSITFKKATIEEVSNNTRFVFDDLDLTLSENEQGKIKMTGFFLQLGKFNKYIGPLTADTAWSHGNIKLANLTLLPGIVLNDVFIRTNTPGGPTVAFNSSVFGGALRGDVHISDGNQGLRWDVVALASDIKLDEWPSVLDLPGQARGRLAEGRFTFRGESARPADAEASLWLVAKDFRWNDHGWESLEIGSSLIHRRLMISNLDLKQKANQVKLNGEISLDEGWGKITESPFLLNVKADIKELASLSGLFGEPLSETAGQLTAEGSVKGRAGELDGFLGVKANNASFRSLPIDQMRLDMVFRRKDVDLVRCEVRSGKDVLEAKGTAQLAAPHRYSAELNTKLTDLAAYLRPFHKKEADSIYGGSLEVRWQGDGTVDEHSGAFDLQLAKFVSAATPAGLTGKFVGTYSPLNLYLSTFEVENKKLRFRSHVSLATTGVTLKDVQLTAGTKPLLEGSAFFPLDPFEFWKDSDWIGAIIDQKNIYLQTSTPNEIDLRDLMLLAGQKSPLRGYLKMQMEAFGPASAFDAKGWIKARDLAFQDVHALPVSMLDLKFQAEKGAASLNGKFLPEGMSPIAASASFALGLFKNVDGSLCLINPEAPFEAGLDIPRTDLSHIRPLFPHFRGLTGEFTGQIKASNSLAKPALHGALEVKNAGFYYGSISSRIEHTNIKATLDGDTLQINKFSGDVSPGKFDLTGQCRFTDPSSPKIEMSLKGERIPLRVDAAVSLFADLNLQAIGTVDEGMLSGSILFTQSKIHRQLTVRPCLGASSVPTSPFIHFEDMLGLIAPAPDWNCDLQVGSLSPILVRDGSYYGQIIPNLYINGTLGAPVPTGCLTVRDLNVHAPAGRLFISEGSLNFIADKPWNPFVAIEAIGHFHHYSVKAFAFGPLNERKWILSSDSSSLSPQDYVLLLEHGVYPASEDWDWVPNELCALGRRKFLTSSWADAKNCPVDGGVIFAASLQPNSGGAWEVDFSDSLNFDNVQTVLPIEGFQSGFEWGFH